MSMNYNMSDKEQVQMLKDWWKKHGTTILVAIAVFFVANIAIRYWKQHDIQQKELSSTAYIQLLNAEMQNKSTDVELFAKNLMQRYSHTVYASLAAMIIAKNDVSAGKLDEALKNLQWAMKHSKSADLKQLATIRSARILLALHKPAEALDLVTKTDQKRLAPALNEVKGDILLAMGNAKDAKDAYQKAEANSADLETQSPLLKMKVAN